MTRGTGILCRWGWFVAFWVGIAIPAFALLMQESTPDLIKIADEMTLKVVRLRGLEPSGPIHKGVKSREEISRYLNEHIRSNYDEDELLRSGRMLQKLALIPAGMNYREFMLLLLTEQVGGFYDPEKKTFFIAGWLPADQQKPVMVHELTHALQDQHYDLNRLMQEDRKLQNDDRLLAHMAFFEGDATAVMLDFLLEPAGRNFTQLPNLVFIMHSQFSSMEAQFEVFRQAPTFIKETLVFPYAFGAAFLQNVRASQPWTAVNKIYADLPASTEQVMHPEKYLGIPRDNPRTLEMADPSSRLGNGWKITYKNVLGEFTLSLMLRTHLAEGRTKAAAGGWGGDKVYLLEDKNGAAAVFCASVWDTPYDADEFYQAMGDWLQAQYPKSHRVDESASGYGLIQSGEYHSLKKDGSRVEFVIGLPEADSSKIRTH
jgi:hypothetical protein